MAMPSVVRAARRQTNGWLIIGMGGAVVVLLPLLSILISLVQPPNENWQHIQDYLVKDYVLQSFWLILITGVLTGWIGLSLAWLVAAYDFPMRRFFRWALVLPLAIPPYVAAYTYSTMFSYTGIVQRTLRSTFGFQPDPKSFGLVSMRGAIFVFALFLFPYVYTVTRSFLERQSGSYIENAILLGSSPWTIFTRIVLPITRPAMIGGVMLVIFEVLGDYGVTSYFGIHTITTAIFRTWFGLYDVDSALRLAAWLMLGVLGLFIAERALRQNRRFSATTSKSRPLAPKPLRGAAALAAWAVCALVFALAFLIPILQLIAWAAMTYGEVLNRSFLALTYRTASVAMMATALTMFFAVVAANIARTQDSLLSHVLTRLVTAGYSIPGAIIAVGVMALFIGLDHRLAPLYAWLGIGTNPLVLSLSLVMMVVAYVVRFMATGYHAVEAGFERIGTRYAEVSRTLGHGITSTFFKVDLPLIRGAVLSGAILTMVEIIKELPLALLLRPFNFETLAIKTYQYASNEQIQEAAVPSLFIIGVSILSVLVLHRMGKESQP